MLLARISKPSSTSPPILFSLFSACTHAPLPDFRLHARQCGRSSLKKKATKKVQQKCPPFNDMARASRVPFFQGVLCRSAWLQDALAEKSLNGRICDVHSTTHVPDHVTEDFSFWETHDPQPGKEDLVRSHPGVQDTAVEAVTASLTARVVQPQYQALRTNVSQ